MSKRYTPDFRTAILQLLARNDGDVLLTSQQTGIPERTLYHWRYKQTLPSQLPQLPPQQQPHDLRQLYSAPPPQQQADENEFDLLRERLMNNALAIADSIKANLDSRSLSIRVTALKTILDSIMDLDNQVPRENGHQTIQIEYVDAEGKTHSAPPWATDEDEDDES